MRKCKCGNYDINDDPKRELCDSCWRDATIAEQQATIERLRAKLANDYLAEPRQQRVTIERLQEELTESLRDTTAARAARDDTIGRNIQLQTKLDAAITALQELHDWQNGPPLQTPKWLEGWGKAMEKARKVLNAGRQVRTVLVQRRRKAGRGEKSRRGCKGEP